MGKQAMSWNVRQIVKMIEGNKINFDLAIQRNHVWDEGRESLLIDSMLKEYPIPAIFTRRVENGEVKIYEVLDGRQRLETAERFVNNKFALQGLESIEIEGEVYELNGKTFEQLPEKLQDIINTASLTIYYLEDETDEEINDIFFRLNNGVPLTNFEHIRTKIPLLMPYIFRIKNHEIFPEFAISEKQKIKNGDEEIVMQMLVTCFNEKPNFAIIKMGEWAEQFQFTITEPQEKQIMDILDIFNYIHQMGHTKAVKKSFKKTHIATLTYLINKYGRDDMSNYVYFVNEFFAGRSTKSDEYATACRGGTAKPDKIKTRFEEADKYFCNMKNTISTEQKRVAATSEENKQESA